MSQDREEKWTRSERILTTIVDSVSTEIDQKSLSIIKDFIENREYGVALEWLHSLLNERSIRVSDHHKEEMKTLARAMNISLDVSC
jgi:hypothetical protein